MSRLKFANLPVIFRAHAPEANDSMGDSPPRRALVIDDDKDVVTLIAAVLCAQGYYVYPAFDGVEGLERFSQVMPDVVLLDVLLPRLDGWAVLRRLRAMSDVPVVMLTGAADTVGPEWTEQLGAADYIVKPFIPRALASRVDELLSSAPEPVP